MLYSAACASQKYQRSGLLRRLGRGPVADLVAAFAVAQAHLAPPRGPCRRRSASAGNPQSSDLFCLSHQLLASLLRLRGDPSERRAADIDENKCQRACKPGSVHRALQGGLGDHSSRRRVAPPLKQPTRATSRNQAHMPPLFGLAPGGVYRAAPVARPRCALAAPFRPYPPEAGRFPFCGTFPEPFAEARHPPGVTRHRCSVEPGLSSPRLLQPRPPGPLARAIWVIAAAAATARAAWPGIRRR